MVGMKKLLVIVCLEILVFSFCSIHKSNSNDNSVRVDNFGHGQILIEIGRASCRERV